MKVIQLYKNTWQIHVSLDRLVTTLSVKGVAPSDEPTEHFQPILQLPWAF